jgi:hypothetical protein
LLGGTLHVRDLVRDGTGAITALGLDFEDFCTEQPANKNYSTFRFHSTTADLPATHLSHTSGFYATSYWFGSVDPGYVSPSASFVLTNMTPVPSQISSVALGGANPGDFSITSDDCTGKTLLANQTCTVQARFVPTGSYQREALLQIADGSLRGLRTEKLTGYVTGPPGPVTGLTATTRSDGVQVRWQLPLETGGSPLQYVEVLRGETADSLQHLGQLAATATSFGDALGSATAPLANHDYVYGVRAHTVKGDGAVVTVTGHTPASPVATTSDAFVTVDGAAGAPNFPAQGFRYDVADGATMTVTSPAPNGGLLLSASRTGQPSFAISRYGGELSATTYTTPFGLSKASQYTSTCSGGPAESVLDVHEVAYNSSGGYARLAADYLLRCTVGGPAVGGTIRWHSDLPYTAADVTTPAAGFPVKSVATTPLLVTYRNRGTTSITLTDLQLLSSGGATTAGWSVIENGCASAVLAAGEQCTATVGVTASGTAYKEVLVAFGDSTSTGQRARKLNVRGVVPPLAPIAHSSNAGTQGVRVSWDIIDGGSGATSWQNYRKLGSASYSFLKTVPASTPFQGMYIDPYLGSGSRSYLVRGVNVAGPGAYSNAVSVLVGPQLPRSVAVAGLTRRVVVSWQPPASSYTTQPLSG